MSDPRASLAADKGQGTGGQNSGGGACCAVVAEQAYSCRGASCSRRIPDMKSTGREGPGLGQKQRTTRGCEVRKVHLARAFVASVGCEAVPAFGRPMVRVGVRCQ